MGTLLMGLTVAVGPEFLRARLNPARTLEDYWTETGLRARDLEEIVEDESCRSSERYFLACANAMNSVANRLGLKVLTTGEVERTKAGAGGETPNEKTVLEPWRAFFNQKRDSVRAFSFEKVWKKIRKSEMTRENEAVLAASAFNGFLSVFRDPHTYIMPVDYYQDVMARANPVSTHLGIVLAKSPENYYLRKVLEDSPAARAGLRRGDWVLSINGFTLKELTPQKLNDLLRGPAGQTVTFVVKRGKTLETFDVRRELAEIPTVSSRLLPGLRRVGVISVHKFAKGTCEKVKEAVEELTSRSARGLLLDLRDNLGGVMDEAACMVSLFVGDEKLAFKVRYLDPSKEPEDYYGSETQIYKGKLAVLINAGSASASEIVAGSLRDHNRALLVGERSFGKGSFQEPETWARNHHVVLFQTKGFYYLPSGRSPQLTGLLPDVPVQFRVTEVLREEDQYLNPLKAPNGGHIARAKSKALSACSDIEETIGEDPQLNQARRTLFCELGVKHAQN